MISVVHVIPSLARSSGGPSICVAGIADACAEAGVRTSICTVSAGPEFAPARKDVAVRRVRGWHWPALRLSFSPLLNRAVRNLCLEMKASAVHSHGLWSQANNVAAHTARRLKVPVVLSTHGMLMPEARRTKPWKKAPAWWLWERANVSAASVLVASCETEKVTLRQLGLNNPVAVIPHGVRLPSEVNPLPRHSGKRTVLFLSRVHPIKGPMDLVLAWKALRPQGWRVVIAGPEEEGYLAELKSIISAAGLHSDFEFCGPVYGAEKEFLLRTADLFILPTKNENFGVAIAEAMAAGLPVITTKGAPWEALVTNHCGWWIDIGAEPLAAALREAVALSDEERRAMGLRGRALVAERFSWDKIGHEMKAVYEWVLGRRDKPDCVSLD